MKKQTNLEAAPALAALARKYGPTILPAVAAVVAPIIAEKIGPKVIGGTPAVGTRRRDLGVIVFRDLVPTLIDAYAEGSET